MLGLKERDQLELFISGSLRELVPDDHILVRVDHVLDLSWLRGEIAELYCAENGRPSIDPEVAVRLMLAGLLLAAATTGTAIATATADAGYAYGKVYGGLERRGIAPLIPAKAEPIKSPVPLRRFRYDAKHDVAKCPRGKVLRPGKRIAHGRFFYARVRDCSRFTLAPLCLSKGRLNKAIVISDDHPALLRARRRRERWSEEDQRLYQRHRWRSEGFHCEAKTWHGLARAVRRGLQGSHRKPNQWLRLRSDAKQPDLPPGPPHLSATEVLQQAHSAALPGGAEDLRYGRLDAFMRV